VWRLIALIWGQQSNVIVFVLLLFACNQPMFVLPPCDCRILRTTDATSWSVMQSYLEASIRHSSSELWMPHASGITNIESSKDDASISQASAFLSWTSLLQLATDPRSLIRYIGEGVS
jgi:hypothetical protein